MNETNDNKRQGNLTTEKDIVLCILCGNPHERREGPVHHTNPLCRACDDSMSRRAAGLKDTVDFHVKGF